MVVWAGGDLCVNVNKGTMRLVAALACQVSLRAIVRFHTAQCPGEQHESRRLATNVSYNCER